MMTKLTVLLVFGLLVSGVWLGYSISKITGAASVDSPRDSLAKCLTEKGVTFYGANWCPHCQRQKELFGSSFAYVNYVECAVSGGSGQAKECSDAGITSYPTWDFGFDRILGVMELNDLAAKSGCPLV